VQGHDRRQFRIGPCLGRGGYGDVYRAAMRSPGGLETTVALKVLRQEVLVSSDAIARLRDEGRMLARINHPVVVRAYDFTMMEGRIALVTEFVDGEDLEKCLQDPGRIGLRALTYAIGQLASALDAAWNATDPGGKPLHIVHRDVKPSNVRLGRHGEVKLLDFGIARFQAIDRQTHTVSDVVMGSIPYVSPERVVERASLPEGDIFGLGCLLYEGLAGERFHRQGSLRTVSTLCSDPERYGEYLSERLSPLKGPPPLLALVRRCLSFDPAKRPAARDLAVDCEAIADELPGPTLRRWCAERSWKAEESPGPITGWHHKEAPPTPAPPTPVPAPELTSVPPPPVPSQLLVLEARPIVSVDSTEAPRALVSLPPPEPPPDSAVTVDISTLPPPQTRPRSSRRAAVGVVTFGCLGLAAGLLLTAAVVVGVGLTIGWP
jgi:serine/threonine protein kinase